MANYVRSTLFKLIKVSWAISMLCSCEWNSTWFLSRNNIIVKVEMTCTIELTILQNLRQQVNLSF